MAAASPTDRKLLIWRFSDGRAGHDSQSQGLTRALSRRIPSIVHDINVRPLHTCLGDWVRCRFAGGETLPTPDLLVGAGHGTHLPMLCARRARGGKIVVLMRPSLPCSWFDACLIPAHDQPGERTNIIITRGAINNMTPSTRLLPDRGLILIGGHAPAYHWDEAGLLEQVQAVVSSNKLWRITDSRRTPERTRQHLRQLASPTVEYFSSRETPPGWLAEALQTAGTVWVSADSISMLYEALTAGAAVGILQLPVKKSGRITRALDSLVAEGLVTTFADWQQGRSLQPPDVPFNEADRCADLLLSKPDLVPEGRRC